MNYMHIRGLAAMGPTGLEPMTSCVWSKNSFRYPIGNSLL